MARARSDKSLARFDRIALVLSGGGALGAYQAGAYAALENNGIRPNWLAGTAVGALNAAIVAGNLPHERAARLRQFWQELSRKAAARHGGSIRRGARALTARWWPGRAEPGRPATAEEPLLTQAELRDLVTEAVDFDRVNAGSVRLVLGAVNLGTGAETFFDNDRHVLAAEHVLASAAFPGMPPIVIERQSYGGSAVSVSLLDEARPADTLCFVVDCYDPLPGTRGGLSRSARDIAALRRNHDLRRMIALLGERLPAAARAEAEVRKCLAEASDATMTLLHLVHEDSAAELDAKMADFSTPALSQHWQAGENDVGTSLAHPRWLAPPPRRVGVVVHELRGGIAPPSR